MNENFLSSYLQSAQEYSHKYLLNMTATMKTNIHSFVITLASI